MTSGSPDLLTVRAFSGPVSATVNIAGSKSIANRALICAALADGTSVLRNVPGGDDTVAMLACLTALGVTTSETADPSTAGTTITVVGRPTLSPPPATRLFAGLAGTTSRFVTALAALTGVALVVDGEAPLRARPFGPLFDALRQMGVAVITGERAEGLPVTVVGPPTHGAVTVSGDVSSQFITALMLVAPHVDGGMRIELTTPLVSRPYVELTTATMAQFGCDGVDVGDRHITVDPGTYLPTTMFVEPDASSASYPLAIAAVAGGSVTVPGLGNGAMHGDARFADVLADMGCTIDRDDHAVTVSRDLHTPLRGVDIDMADISDLVPTLAVVAACASTPSTISGVGFIRGKESDRLGDLSAELRKAGVSIDELDDGLLIRPSLATLRPARLATHHDHRLAMAFGVLGTVEDGITVESPSVVSKSWPEFWAMIDELRP
ncbi:MAG TPA: 3-phosphoshikimate 1-carboxyvinyltransferase [Ilumatobacter sp.]|nr:3-phosphoshikimate 1-carboxyvinyltransferase [Ilumatobacter sp.]